VTTKSNSPGIGIVTHPVAVEAVAADSPSQFCQRLSISQSTFFELVKAGRIKTTKIGRRTVVPRAEILRIMSLLDNGGAL
jgi:excisionase family DNA binding protein